MENTIGEVKAISKQNNSVLIEEEIGGDIVQNWYKLTDKVKIDYVKKGKCVYSTDPETGMITYIKVTPTETKYGLGHNPTYTPTPKKDATKTMLASYAKDMIKSKFDEDANIFKALIDDIFRMLKFNSKNIVKVYAIAENIEFLRQNLEKYVLLEKIFSEKDIRLIELEDEYKEAFESISKRYTYPAKFKEAKTPVVVIS